MSSFSGDSLLENLPVINVVSMETLLFAKLRNCFNLPAQDTDEKIGLEDSVINILKELRSKALLCEISEDFVKIFVETWKYLSMLNEANDFHLPPPYDEELQGELIATIITRIFSLNKGMRYFTIGGNPILYGCKGVGKTTIQRVVGMCSSVLCSNVFPLYWNYEFSCLELNTMVDAGFNCYEVKKTGDYCQMLLLDEFTLLYDSEQTKSNSMIMKNLQLLMKNSKNVYCILSASKCNVDRYYDPDKKYKGEGYPNLNNSIFLRRQVLPIRNAVSVLNYITRRYGMTVETLRALVIEYRESSSLTTMQNDLSENDVGNHIIHWTGGIGRYIDLLLKGGSVSVFEDRTLFILSQPALLNVCLAILHTNPSLKTEKGSVPFPVDGIYLQSALNLIRHFGGTPEQAVSHLYKWCDSMILHIDSKCNVCFMFPAQACALHKAISDDDVFKKIQVLAHSLHGFEGSPPGLSNEFLFDFLYEKHHVEGVGSDQSLVLNTSNNEVTVFLEKGTSRVIVQAIELITNRMMKWRVDGSEQGIDRIIVRPDPIAPSQYIVEGIQLKTGRKDKTISRGTLDSQRAKNVVDDSCVMGMLVKAERGFKRLLCALRVCFPLLTFTPSSLTIYTTKCPCKENTVISDAHLIQDELVNDMFDRGVNNNRCNLTSFSWEIYYSTGWLRDILPVQYADSLFMSVDNT